ncbi:MAG: response regulator [Candidatus Latescibacterota bacterium]|nr:response regulator [Candidatus Latescibacterota bacterium]MEE3338848.1 response regulator [Candidatus Latescibacterota bacterium]
MTRRRARPGVAVESKDRYGMGCCVNEVEADRMKPSFLVVDDQPENLDVILATLALEGFDLRVAISGPAAIELAGEMIPDLILLDVMMPDMDGFETCRRLCVEAISCRRAAHSC